MTPAISRWLARWPVPFTVEMAQARIADALDGMAQGRTLFCMIEHQGTLEHRSIDLLNRLDKDARKNKELELFSDPLRSEEALAGCIGGGRLPGTNRASFGFWLGEPHHGQALMREAAPAFVEAIRTSLALTSIEAACQPENHASAKVIAACGLHRIGTRIEHVLARNREEEVDVWERNWAPQPSSMGP